MGRDIRTGIFSRHYKSKYGRQTYKVLQTIRSKGFDGVKSYPSTVASFKFKVGTVQGNLLLEIYFLAVILFTNTSFKEVDVDVFVASTTQPREEVSERIKYALYMAMQNFDGRKMFLFLFKLGAG